MGMESLMDQFDESVCNDLKEAFNAGVTWEKGCAKSWSSYNKFTGHQDPNPEMTFEQWYKSRKPK